ncbi:MAG: DUF4920 domain-containing protein [Myxococcales bacterium]|nr:DUF4920 domain-containing protein [Myxococcales bacterium]
MRVRALALSVVLGAAACESNPPAPEPAQPSPVAPPPATASVAPARAPKAYGAPIKGSTAVALGEVLGKPESYEGKSVVVEGEVRRACSKKGCWMELAESVAAEARGARVTFKDYGFFVPTDSAGAHAKLEGVVNVQLMKKGHVEHLEEEGAKFANKNPDGTVREVQFVATGVELTK